ncbi:hypothetical protein [Arenibacter troitsensis]|uniref:Uncharacterized protein n=1 Tax=Arenibacter troitsensis TaxID=188872 RepID=A0A1X7IDM7_9FLAO|nr:hypothetical protein [Arenibacter troitsensis]MDX1767589.1 hypothetical protein [Arenibacter troitsensis]SMG12816.1 hypothetical protein SAMN03080602_00725 [Arenibacter troitsensis]
MEILDTILENSYQPLYAVTLSIALIRYPKYYNTPLKYFPILLMYTFLNELLGYFTKNYEVFHISIFSAFVTHNVFIYNIYNIVFFSYFFYVYWKYIETKKYRTYIILATAFYLMASLANPFFQNFKLESQVFSYLAGAFAILICIILFFIEHRQSSKKLDFRFTGIKWISIGLLIFYLGYAPIKASRFYNYTYQLNEYVHLRRIHLSLIVLMYISFIIGFLRMKRKFWI